VLSLPLRVHLQAEEGGWSPEAGRDEEGCATLALRVTGVDGGGKPVSARKSVSLRCRAAGAAFLFGFLDHDGSVAHAAAIPPRGAVDASSSAGVFLSLAGVGVRPQQQAESHKYVPKGKSTEFVFGFKALWTLAPERDGAHNWEGVGLQTAARAVDALVELARHTAWPAQAGRLHVSGHSRGGCGPLDRLPGCCPRRWQLPAPVSAAAGLCADGQRARLSRTIVCGRACV
jgi:hypothetical protein